MEIKEIEGKKFISYEEHRKQRARFILQIAFLIGIVFASFAMLKAIDTLIENRDIIGRDPLIYGMELHNISYCDCLDFQGKEWNFNKFEVNNGAVRYN